MPVFSYQAIDEYGSTVKGSIEADSEAMAESMLIAKGYIPAQIRDMKADAPLWKTIRARLSGVKPQDLILFTKQFRSMLHAGVPILRLMQVLDAQTENAVLKSVVSVMSQDIKKGSSLFEALEKHPQVFSPLYRSMIRAGEMSGSLPEVMARLIYIIEHETKIKSDIKSALQYPKMVLIALGGAFFVLLGFVIPKFVDIFTKSGIALPLPTKMAMGLYGFLSNYWYLILALAVALIGGGRRYLKTQEGILFKDDLVLRLPVFGPLYTKAIMARFASIFAILHSSGVPVMNSMDILAGTIGNMAVAREVERVREQMGEGQGISGPLKSARYFTPMVVDMAAIAEESGNIEEMMREITVHYDDEVSYAVKGLSDALGPVLIVGLAAVVGFFALAVFLPMWDLTKMVK